MGAGETAPVRAVVNGFNSLHPCVNLDTSESLLHIQVVLASMAIVSYAVLFDTGAGYLFA